MSGTVNISRTIWQDAAFKNEPLTEREAFVWLIMDASYKTREKRVGSVTVTLQRGQLIASVRFMAEAWQWSKSRVARYLERLENRDMIGTDSGTGVNVVTICKYEEYQNKPKGSGTAINGNRDSSGTAAGQQRDKPNTDSIQDEIQEKEDTNVSLSVSPDAVPANDLSKAVSKYNESAADAGWPQVQKLNPPRSKQLRSRLKDCDGLEGWSIALEKAQASDFLCGRTERPWTGFGFDWLIKPANFTKLMEGNYDNRDSNPSGGGMAGQAYTGRGGRGSGIAGAVARRQFQS